MLVYRQGWRKVGSRRAVEHGHAPPLDRDYPSSTMGNESRPIGIFDDLGSPYQRRVPLARTCSVGMTSFLLGQGRVYRHLLPDDCTGLFR